MIIQDEISPDLKNLDRLNAMFSWIPSSKHIRPSSSVMKEKFDFFDLIQFQYPSVMDFVLHEIFGPLKHEGTRVIENPNGLFALALNRFPYSLPNETVHYILWMVCNQNLSGTEITLLIKSLLSIPTREFVWFSNPKKTFVESFGIYHVQVFIRGYL
jgi:hypothetical protein